MGRAAKNSAATPMRGATPYFALAMKIAAIEGGQESRQRGTRRERKGRGPVKGDVVSRRYRANIEAPLKPRAAPEC